MKAIKLLLIAVVIVGVVSGLMMIIPETKPIDKPAITSAAGESWMKKIDALCKDGAWSSIGYTELETGIQIDMKPETGNLGIDEGNALHDYLYASSCYYVKDGADKLFKKNVYPIAKLKHYENAISKLKENAKTNSNLTEAINMYNSYHQILSLVSYNGGASYSHPLKAYSGRNASSIKAKVQNMPYFKSHFSNNDDINAKLNRLDSSMSDGESKYYADLEKLIENHYNKTKNLETLLDDQIQFNSISTNQSAIDKLNNFINNGI